MIPIFSVVTDRSLNDTIQTKICNEDRCTTLLWIVKVKKQNRIYTAGRLLVRRAATSRLERRSHHHANQAAHTHGGRRHTHRPARIPLAARLVRYPHHDGHILKIFAMGEAARGAAGDLTIQPTKIADGSCCLHCCSPFSLNPPHDERDGVMTPRYGPCFRTA